MKHIKSISLLTIALLVSSIVLSSFSVVAETETGGCLRVDFTEDDIESWLTFEGDNTQINNDKSLGLISNITNNSVRAASPTFSGNDSEDGIFYISYDFMVNQSSESGFTPDRYLRLVNADNLDATPTVSVNLARVRGSSLYIGSTNLASVNNEQIYNLKLKVDTVNSTLEAWLDSVKITSNPVSFTKPKNMDY